MTAATLRLQPMFPASPATPGAVLHVVGRITESVFSFLGPVTSALAAGGIAQTVVLVDDPRLRHQLPRFHESVRLVLTDGKVRPGSMVRNLLDAFCDAARARHPTALHLHGPMCSLLGLYAARFRGLKVPLYVSPHGVSHGRSALIPRLLAGILRRFSVQPGSRPVVGLADRAPRRTGWVSGSSAVMAVPVSQTFVDTRLAPAPTPRIVAGSGSLQPEGPGRVAQCAVLLADQVAGLHFAWIGPLAGASADRLRAANVACISGDQDKNRATSLATAWIHLATSSAPGFPMLLVEAMAMGLPCVAWDTPAHRAIIDDRQTGFLCGSADELLDIVVALMESAPLRQRIGRAARQHVRARFDGGDFRRSLLSAYGTGLAA